VLTALQRAILIEILRACWPVRSCSDGTHGGELAAAIHLGFSKEPDAEHAAWLFSAGDFDWVGLRGVTRRAYRRYTGADGAPSGSFRVSFHRAIRTLAAKDMVELLNKQPKTKAKTRRQVESLRSVRPKLSGLLAVGDEPIADDYSGDAFPTLPGYTKAIRVRTYYVGPAMGSYPRTYTWDSDFISNARRAERFVPQTWREWWRRKEMTWQEKCRAHLLGVED
jgi:hypothetical protein